MSIAPRPFTHGDDTKRLKTSWDDHYMFPAYLDFLSFALGEDEILAQFRAETGSRYQLPRNGLESAIDAATGADLAFLQAFSDFCERVHFGTPATLAEVE